jgi:S1-C subfamily serine protease
MTNEMQQQYLPYEPPPPPSAPPGAVYGHWSPDPVWGPPSWPPTAPAKSRPWHRVLLAGLAIVCLGAGGGTAYALTSSSLANHAAATLPAGNSGNSGQAPSGSSGSTAPPSGSSASSAAIAKVDAATVDINAVNATGNGEVAGTGMIITSSGEVLTNNHVIAGTVHITAQIDGAGTIYTATVIGYDAADDVALLQLKGASSFPTVPLGDSSKVNVGDQLTVIGNALGRGGTPAVVSGTVSQLDQEVTASDETGDTESLTGMIQVEADIQPGDSGGPEINAAGQVVGITTAGSQSGRPGQVTSATTGFAVPINKAMQVVAQIRAGGGPNVHIGNAAYLGVGVNPGGTNGAVVGNVIAGAPAATAGMVAGDRIVKVGNQTITSASDLHKAMLQFSSGQTVSFTWIDPSGASHTAVITLALAAFAA